MSVALFANVFLPFWRCLFILFIASFALLKLLGLFNSHLFIFVFIFVTLGDGSKKILLGFKLESVCLCFPY